MTEWCITSRDGGCGNTRCRYNLAQCREATPLCYWRKGTGWCEGFQKPKQKTAKKAEAKKRRKEK